MRQKIKVQIVLVTMLLACTNITLAQWSSYQSQPQCRGGTTYYNNANGSSAGLSYRTGNTTYYNNANGSFAGSSYRTGNTTYYNNANVSAAGSSYRTGNTTYYNNANDSSA